MEKIRTPSQPEPENKSLGCLFMKLEGILVYPLVGNSKAPESTQNDQLKLHLTIQFKEQRELLVGGYIKFGLKGGRLRVKLKNAEIPLASKQLGRSFELAVQKKRQPQEASINQSNIEDSLPDQPGVTTNEPQTVETEQSQLISCQVSVKGTPNRPVWVFEVDKGGSVLKGILKNTVLATLDITAKPCYIEATFEVSPRDVHLSEAEGLWQKDISKKKSVVIERAIARRFLEKELKPYLSRQALRYE